MLPNWYGIPGIGFEWCGSQSVLSLGIDSIILGAVWGFVFLGMLVGW